MTSLLLQTKLHPPLVRPNLVPRPHLLNKINADGHSVLTLVVAPAGFGKTTLAAYGLEQGSADGEQQAAWVSLDEADSDPTRFAHYVIAALQTAAPDVGRSALNSLHGAQAASASPPLNTVMTALINDLTLHTGRVVLVLDDYHLITNPAIHSALAFLIDHAPQQLHLIITSREEPPLPLPRWRVRGILREVIGNDLLFTATEAAAFLQDVMHLNLAEGDIAQLAQRTEGWIAGLQLAALSLQRQPDLQPIITNFAGNDRSITSYLVAEVLERQTDEIRTFLLHTAVLDRFNADLCTAVLAGKAERSAWSTDIDAAVLLEQLETQNLFLVPLDNQRHWYRYHHLFAEFLQEHLQRTAPERVRGLHCRASAWYSANGFVQEAITHALAANDWHQAATLMEQTATDVLHSTGHVSTILRWFAQLPEADRLARPPLALTYVLALWVSGQYDCVEQELARLAPIIAASDTEEAAVWRGQYLMYRAEHAITCRDVAEAEQLFAEAKSLVPATDTQGQRMIAQGQGYIARINGDVTLAHETLSHAYRLGVAEGNAAAQLYALYDLAEMHIIEGQLNAAFQLHDQMMQQAGGSEPLTNPIVCLAHIGRGEVLTEWNRLEEAVDHLDRGYTISQQAEFFSVANLAHLAMARVYQGQGRMQAAQEAMQKAVDAVYAANAPWVRAQVEVFQARLWLQQGNLAAAQRWAAAVRRSDGQRPALPAYQHHREQVTLGRLLLVERQYAEAIALLNSCRVHATHAGWNDSLIEIWIVLALAHYADNNLDAALAHVQKALTLAEPEGYVRRFVDEGRPMAELLRHAVSREIAPFYVGKIQAAFLPTIVTTQPLPEPLTKRELSVLRLIATGMSNQEIADELIVAIGTVGKYTNNIFTKLYVRNRTQAVERARELGLL